MNTTAIELQSSSSEKNISADSWIFLIPHSGDDPIKPVTLQKQTPSWEQESLKSFQAKRKYEAKCGTHLSYDLADAAKRTHVIVDTGLGMFEWLSQARKVCQDAIFNCKLNTICIDLRHMGELTPSLADAWVAAISAGLYKFPKYKGPNQTNEHDVSNNETPHDLKLFFLAEKANLNGVDKAARQSLNRTASGTNIVRWLSKRAGNDLNCKKYLEYISQMAKVRKWKYEHINDVKLNKIGAGAFLSVVQGSEHKDFGIVKLSYSPSHAKKSLSLVGKGLMFDTGGHSLKSSQYMLGMHGDMAGSAVALAILNVATIEQWPIAITAYLAVADNMIGPKAYKPNDVITAMNGTTIEVIDTDAEGRMVLADTLYLACKDSPSLIMDFATLTGACVRAIGTTFSGVFTNRSQLHSTLIDAGYKSGERVWPFPMDKDFADCLDSTSADTKQCREKGGVDHIEASQFLSKFIDKKIPWVHVDLSAIENSGGLAHIASDETGFGVRFASQFIRDHFKF
ncbi:MAG: leucyl aminopeptidase family protein [Proteobacteria bacterium]|nr:leucyl aminopeptidase family protein [Pseudomonadota bacterium]